SGQADCPVAEQHLLQEYFGKEISATTRTVRIELVVEFRMGDERSVGVAYVDRPVSVYLDALFRSATTLERLSARSYSHPEADGNDQRRQWQWLVTISQCQHVLVSSIDCEGWPCLRKTDHH